LPGATFGPTNPGMNFPTSKASAAATVNEPAGKLGKSAGGAEFSALAQASILIIDDEPGMRNFLMRTLGPRCKHVAEAADTDEASRQLDSSRFDVVILDNIMPGKNGVDWLALLWQNLAIDWRNWIPESDFQ